MTEQIQDQISAFVDDELSADECEFLVRRLERDPAFRQRALSYATAGAALRGEILNPDPDLLRRRVQRELGVASTPVRRPSSTTGLSRRVGRPALGVGIAASVAAVALLAFGSLNRSVTPMDRPLIASDLSVVPPLERASYVVPQEASTTAPPVSQPLAAPIRLTNYLVTHGEYVRGFGRTSIHTDVVGNRGAFVLVGTAAEQD